VSAAVIAALAALLGLMLGRLWDVRAEHTRWRRDQRVNSYQILASEFYRLREGMRRVSRVGPEDEQFSILVDNCRDVGTDWNESLISVWLHGSERVVGAARHLDDAVNELFTLVRERQLSPAEWRIEREPSQQCLEAFIEAVRRDLQLQSLPFYRHWRPPELAGHQRDIVTDSSQ
jgi:hypothetical protein